MLVGWAGCRNVRFGQLALLVPAQPCHTKVPFDSDLDSYLKALKSAS